MSYLAKLLDSTRARVAEAKERVTADALEQRIAAAGETRSFGSALVGPEVAIIAEIKRASPSKGVFDANLSASAAAADYARGGAAALSVLTEPEFFRGSLDDLSSAASAGLPLLRKDFIVDEFQVLESRAAGADALLLIVRALGDDELSGLMAASRSLGMDALVEVHELEDLDRAMEAGADLIGVNNRDLETFEVDEQRTADLASRVSKEVTLVSLSGVSTRAAVEAQAAAGAHAVLVGEALVRSEDPASTLRELRGVDAN
ncbi:MAG: indole-3-glycerol phosphate synthase TrpC [Actinomycetota bacterium]